MGIVKNDYHEAARNLFVPALVTDKNLEVVIEDGEETAVIDGKDIPIFSDAFDLRIIQPQNGNSNPKFTNKAGKIYIDGLDDFFDERMLLPLTLVRYGQNLFQGEYKPGSPTKPVCFSGDALEPSRRVLKPISHVCGEQLYTRDGQPYIRPICPKAMWGEDGQKPECRRYIVISLLDVTDPDMVFPVRMQLKGAGYAAWTALNNTIKRISNVAKLKRQSVFDYVFKLTVEDKGTYYVPMFTAVYSEDKPSKYLPLRARYKGIINRTENSIMKSEEEDGTVEAKQQLPHIDVEAVPAEPEEASQAEFKF